MKKRLRKHNGFITVFVTLIMVPVIVVTGTMVDLARIKLYSSQAVMAADSYGEAVLSKYDNLLKELYGLFALTQSEEGLKTVKELAEYAGYSFDPAGGDLQAEGFMPYKDAKVKISYEKVENATLANESVLMTQISDFMKYRVYLEIGEDLGIFDMFSSVTAMSDDMKAIEQRQEVGADTDEIFHQMELFYKNLKKLDHYPDFISEAEEAYREYAFALKEIYSGTLSVGGEEVSYTKYQAYLADKDHIDAAKAYVEDAEAKAAEYEKELEEYEADVAAGREDASKPDDSDVPKISDADREMAEKYVDQAGYQAAMDQELQGLQAALTVQSEIAFGDVEGIASEMQGQQQYIEAELSNIEQQVADLKSQLERCSEDLKASMREEIKELEEIADKAGAFKHTVELLGASGYNSVQKDKDNKVLWEENVAALIRTEENLRTGTQDKLDWDIEISFVWESFKLDSAALALYQGLEAFFTATEANQQNANKNAGEEKKEAAKEAKEKALQEAGLEQEEKSEARDIPTGIISELGGVVDTGTVPSLTDWAAGDASLKAAGNAAIGKFLLSVYDFGMFSSRVSGIDPKEDTKSEAEQITEKLENIQEASQQITEAFYDESLTGIKISQDVNYLYGAEIEYLLSGYDTSDKNLTYARNYICTIRTTMNFISTYTIDEIDSAIKTVANLAAEAVAASGVGAVAAPLVRFAVSGALRAAIAGIETASDWKLLKERKAVIFYKNECKELNTIGAIASLLDGELDTSADTEEKDTFKLTYEDYMYVLMYLFVDASTLLQRTSNLITLNVNLVQQGTDQLEKLEFKMSETVTAVKSTCTIDIDFLIVPKNYINMFIPNSSTTNVMQKLEDGSYAYSMIRGY